MTRLPGPSPALVMFDVDYTLLRPGACFEADGYLALGRRFGLELDVTRWGEAEGAAHAAVRARRERLGTVHDDGVYEVIAKVVIEALGGDDPETVAAAARAQVDEWGRFENFALYDDVVPCLRRLRAGGVRIALVSNTNRDLRAALERYALTSFVDHSAASCDVGHCKPARQIFDALLSEAGVAAGRAVMVGDNLEDDIRGALAAGCRAVLLDRDGRWDVPLPTIHSLDELPALLGLPS